MTHEYSTEFFDYTERESRASAEQILPIVQKILNIRSVLDVGCARGVWLSVWARLSVVDVCGIDGSYIDAASLHFPSEHFIAHDLSQPFSLPRTFDLVTSLEVAEHLPRAASSAFVKSLTKHSDFVLFSAAVPGQGGEHHINERPLCFWRSLFENQGYMPVDFLRPIIQSNLEIAPWYRNNTILYARKTSLANAPTGLRACMVRPDEKLASYGGFGWLLRRSIVQLLPRALVTLIAQKIASRKAAARAKPG